MKLKRLLQPRRMADNAVTYLLLLAVSALFLFPCLWLILASFSKSGDIYSFSGFFPTEYSANTFIDLFTNDVNGLYPYGRWFLNTLYVASMSCLIGTLLVILTGYVMSRFRFRGRDTIKKTTLLLGMFPGFMGMTAIYIIMTQLGLLDSLASLIFLYAGRRRWATSYRRGILTPSRSPFTRPPASTARTTCRSLASSRCRCPNRCSSIRL